MEIEGTVHNGVIVPDQECALPEGTKVRITPGSTTPAATIWDKLVRLAQEAEQKPCPLPEDLAENHDHYLHGLPKKS